MERKYELVRQQRMVGLHIEGHQHRFDVDAVYLQIESDHLIVPESRVMETMEAYYGAQSLSITRDVMQAVTDMRQMCTKTQLPLLQVENGFLRFGTSELSMENLN